MSQDRRQAANPVALKKLSVAFLDAIQGREEDLRTLLAEDVVMRSNGAPGASSTRHPLTGAERVARFFHRVSRAPASRGAEPRVAWFNGGPGILVIQRGAVVTALQLSIRDDRISEIASQRDPDKLPSLDAKATGRVVIRAN